MVRLLSIFLDIALLRARPQQLPASPALLALLLLFHLAFGCLLALFDNEPLPALALALALTLLMAAYTDALLLFRRRRGRLLQSLSALAGTDLVVGLVLLPLQLLAGEGSGGETSALIGLLSLLILGWSIAITTHIYRHALDLTVGPAVLVALAYMVLSLLLAGLLAPPA